MTDSAKRKPPRAGMGRKKGVPNKITKALKDMILQALANVGGENYLQTQAAENPTAFLTLVGKVLPLQVKQDGQDPRVPIKQIVHEHKSS